MFANRSTAGGRNGGDVIEADLGMFRQVGMNLLGELTVSHGLVWK